MSPASQSVVFPSTVLIVDDNKLSNENLAQILMLSGYKTQIADNGASALNSIKHHTPDLILLDVKLPDFNGIDLCKNLKKDPIASTIPVIFMSGYTETDSILSALEAGGVDFISKPFQSVEVLARIKTHLTISSELAARKRAEELLQKNESALKEALIVGTSFIDAGTGSVDFTVISDTILKISGAKYVSFNLFESNGLDFTTVSIAGISDHIQKFPAMFGIDIINKKWKHDPVRAEKTKDKNITHFETLHELTGSAIPAFVSEMVERVFDIGCVELVKISKNNKVLGDFTLLFSRGESIRYQDIVLLFSSQVGLFLDRIQAERTVEKQSQLLQSMGRMASVGGWEIDVETMNLIWTDEVYRIHEAAPDFIPSVQTAINFYAPESKTSIADAVQQAIDRGTPFDLELSIITARGNHRIVHTLGQAQLENGIVKRIFGTFQDITEQQKLLEVAQQTEKLESIGSLAGGIAHDFNNLLAGIFGYIDMARDSVDPQSKAAGYLAKALNSYTKACALTQQFLTFAKGGAPQRTTGSLAPLITEATQFTLHSAFCCDCYYR